MIELEDLCIEYTAVLRDALVKMDRNGMGILFVVDQQKLSGVVTDGDVRRAIISGKTVDDLIEEICNKDCKSLSQNASTDEIQRSLSSRVRAIPLIDEQGSVVDFCSHTRLKRIPVLEPFLGGNELEYVSECITTNWVSSQGKYVQRFEEEVKQYTGSKYALAVSNGTVALHLALVSLGVGPGDEVLVPDITFGATLNAVVLAGATPVLVDVDKTSWNLSVNLVRECINPKTKAVMPVHIYGVPCDMPEIVALAKEHDLLVIEDCAEALGSSINGQHVGTFGDIGTFSFFGNKVITCGEGGAVIFSSEETYNRAKILRDHGMTPGKRYWHDVVGFNYRLTNLQAALGCAQFEQLPQFRFKRREIYSWYETYLLSSGYFDVQDLPDGYESSYWLFTVGLKAHSLIPRDNLIEKLSRLGVDTRPVFYPMSQMPPFVDCEKHLFGVSASVAAKGISLPTSVYLEEDDVKGISEKVVGAIESYIQLQQVYSS